MPKIKEEDLTEEDHSRRSRRRERNKVAATKCRNKKKAKTVTLMKVRYRLDMIYPKTNNRLNYSSTALFIHSVAMF